MEASIPPLVTKSKPIPISKAIVEGDQDQIGDKKLEQGNTSTRSDSIVNIALEEILGKGSLVKKLATLSEDLLKPT